MSEQIRKNWSKLVAKVWSDDALAQRLQNDPKAVLKENGIDVPDGMNITVHQNSPSQLHISVPSKHKEGNELNEHELETVAGGGCCQSMGTNC